MSDATNSKTIDDLSNKYLTFLLGEDIHCLELSKVTEIIGVQHMTRVPGLPQYIIGLINLRGKVVPVINARTRMGYQNRDYDDKTCTVIVEYKDALVGLLVDCVSEVVAVDEEEVALPPKMSKKEKSKFLKSIIHKDGKIILVVDCEKIFDTEIQ